MGKLSMRDIKAGFVTHLLQGGWDREVYRDEQGKVIEVSFTVKTETGSLQGLSFQNSGWTASALEKMAQIKA